MRSACRCILFVYLSCLLSVQVWGITYGDDFTDGAITVNRTYTGLGFFAMDAAEWAGLPDKSAFSFSNPTVPLGSVTYRVRNAQQVRVGLYTPSGAYLNASQEKYYLGVAGGDARIGTRLEQALYSPSALGIYTYVGGSLYKAHAGDNATVFLPASETPTDLIGYGANVYTSSNGSNWQRHTLSPATIEYSAGNPLVYEEYVASVPTTATYIRVELNDVLQLPLASSPGSYTQKAANCLASVAISGTNLTLGVQESVVVESTSSTSSSTSESSSEQSSRRSSSSSTASTANSSSRAKEPSQQSVYSSSKFEGVIVSSSTQSTSVRSSSASPKPNAPEETPSAEDAEEIPPQEIIYRIESAAQENNYFTVGITAYIIGIIGILLFLLLSASRQK